MGVIGKVVAGSAVMMTSGIAAAEETVTYAYDAQGRLVQVVKSGSQNNGVVAQYTHDKAGNRTKVKVTGSPNGTGR